MTCDANVQKGNELVLLARNDLDTLWEIIGGVVDFGYNGETPTDSTTSSSTTSGFEEVQATGYKNFSMTAPAPRAISPAI